MLFIAFFKGTVSTGVKMLLLPGISLASAAGSIDSHCTHQSFVLQLWYQTGYGFASEHCQKCKILFAP
jgi:hypothetical protein